jgi:hypothetical protein
MNKNTEEYCHGIANYITQQLRDALSDLMPAADPAAGELFVLGAPHEVGATASVRSPAKRSPPSHLMLCCRK